MNVVLKTSEYKKSYTLMQANKSFVLVSSRNESKLFEPNSVIYNVRYLRDFFKFCQSNNEDIVQCNEITV